MKDRRSRFSKEMREFVREAKDFILAINQGATARELEKIRNSIRGKQDKSGRSGLYRKDV